MLLAAVVGLGLLIETVAAQVKHRAPPHRWQWNVFATGNSDLPANGVWALSPAGDGALWVGTAGGLARLAGGQVEQVFTTEQGLPDNEVFELSPAGDGALWVGTDLGLARLAGGQVEQVFTTEQGLPANRASALSPAGDGALWVGTAGGLTRLRISTTRPRIVKLVGRLGSEGARITQTQHTFAAVPFDPKYLTEGREWRFLWRLEAPSGKSQELTTRTTRSPYYEAAFKEDGFRIVSVQAIDEYGLKSDASDPTSTYKFEVAVSKEDPVEVWLDRLGLWGCHCIRGLLPGAVSLDLALSS